jgi:hypothetical protein
VTEEETGIIAEDSLDMVGNMTSPRLIKTHLSWEMLPSAISEKNVKVYNEKSLKGT